MEKTGDERRENSSIEEHFGFLKGERGQLDYT